MICRSTTFLVCIFLAAATATDFSGPDAVTESDPEVTANRLTTDNIEPHTLDAGCEQQAESRLTVETAAAAAVAAVRSGCASHRRSAVAFIRDHLLPVLGSQGWEDAMRSHTEELIRVSRLLGETSAPAPADSGATPAAQPHSDHINGSQTAASAALPTAACHTPSPDYATVCPLWSLCGEEKGKRLIVAAKEGAVDELVALLAAGSDVGTRDNKTWTALHWAADKGHEEAARRLLAAGAEVDARDSMQWTPLHEAAWRGYPAVVRLLLAACADPNAREEKGGTPLHCAAFWRHIAVVAMLLEAGADKGIRTDSGETPLDVAGRWVPQQLIDMLS